LVFAATTGSAQLIRYPVEDFGALFDLFAFSSVLPPLDVITPDGANVPIFSAFDDLEDVDASAGVAAPENGFGRPALVVTISANYSCRPPKVRSVFHAVARTLY
jgi:hypothetical protein